MSEQDESLVFVFSCLFLFFYDSTNDVADSLAFDSFVLGGGRCVNQRGAFLLHDVRAHPPVLPSPFLIPPRFSVTVSSALVSCVTGTCLLLALAADSYRRSTRLA